MLRSAMRSAAVMVTASRPDYPWERKANTDDW